MQSSRLIPRDIPNPMLNSNMDGADDESFLVYDTPFWRKMGLSGQSESQYGLLTNSVMSAPE